MSAVKFAQGGDGWTFWTTQRRGDDVRVIVTSSTETINGEPVVIADEVIRDQIGTQAITRALSISNDHGRRMYS